ncbi:ABC1 kinase family protein [Litoreibacter ponti]|nr:AarF/ABC1/UbiB kinase family protein [Litoreibacter ponti]
MSKFTHTPRGLAVPDGRLTRMARLGGVAAGVAGSLATGGARELLAGRRPQMSDLLLTPANAARLTNQLAQMRGAAMKMGQLMSMEAGEFLPPELADILAHLRADAHFMPPQQLKKVLIANWGADFLKRFKRFDVYPIAAASIGQVHRGVTKDGREVAVKVQYPGVRKSIDSDVSNVAALMRLSGLIPKELDLSPLLDEARRQLHEEADYLREGQMLARFGTLMAGETDFRVPALYADLTTADILGMEYVPGVAVESLSDADQATRNRVTERLIMLTLRELFDLGVMQTDPNFANYRYDAETGQIILLDFGAAREIVPELSAKFRALLRAGLQGTREDMRRAAIEIGYFNADTSEHHQRQILDMMEIAFTPLRSTEPFDFATNPTVAQLRDAGMEFGRDRDFWVIPPMDTLYIQRKFAGIYLLATRLKARVNVAPILHAYL